MAPSIELLRRALEPRYEVLRLLGSGGMGTVFLGRDATLDRSVAIKVLLPELATAVAAERFRNEARLLAQLSHPCVIPVHEVGEADGFLFYVMDYVAGPTLRERLAEGPLEEGDVIRIGRDLLSALEAAHGKGIVHRDVKPANVFLVGDRSLLGDFGISKEREGGGEALTEPGGRVGTPGYMPPEQAAGRDVTSRTDLCAVGMVLYEAATGRRWTFDPSDRSRWSGMSRGLADVLRRALAWAPEERWSDAGAFADALARLVSRRRRRLVAVAAIAGLAVLGGLALRGSFQGSDGGGEEGALDLHVAPFLWAVPSDSAFGRDLARLAAQHLSVQPWLTLTPTAHGFCQTADPGGSVEATGFSSSTEIPASFHVTGRLAPLGDSTEVRLTVYDAEWSEVTDELLRVPRADSLFAEAGTTVALAIFRAVRPDIGDTFRELTGLSGRPITALRQFLLGEQALRCNDRPAAQDHLARAVELDSTFVLAAWHLAIVRHWLQLPSGVDLRALYERSAGQLSPRDSLLLSGYIQPEPQGRLAAYREAAARFPDDGWVLLFLGDELFHRGPLFGVPAESAFAVLGDAVRDDSLLALASDHRTWLAIRLGERELAEEALGRYTAVSAASGGRDVVYPALYAHALLARFDPAAAQADRDLLFSTDDPAALDRIRLAARMALSFEIPETQLDLGGRLASAAGATSEDRATGSVARALALVALGRVPEALAAFDEASGELGTAFSRLQAAEWRVLPPALGLFGHPESEIDEGRDALRSLFSGPPAADPEIRAAAAFALAVWARATADDSAGRAWTDSLRSVPGIPEDPLLSAWESAGRGRWTEAVAMARPALAWDSAGRTRRPFRRGVVRLVMSRWMERTGDFAEADRLRIWTQANDIDRIPRGPAQAGEIDWALAPYVEWVRARAAASRGDPAFACPRLDALLRRWSGATSPVVAVRDSVEVLRGRECTE